MEKFLSFFALCCFSLAIQAQPVELLLPSTHRIQMDNPATMGLDGRHHLHLGATKQWYGMHDSPTTFFLTSSHPLIGRGVGIGGALVYDRAGLITQTRAGINATVHFNPEGVHRFSFGAGARFQYLGFKLANVEEFYSAGMNASAINASAGLNYQFVMEDKKSFFNVFVMLPQLPVSVTLNGDALSTEFRLLDNIVAQANLRYELGNGMALTPALRYQAQVLSGFASKTQVIDGSVGLSFANDRFQVRLGGRTGAANLLYGAVGITMGEVLNAHVFVEPFGPLGISGTFDAEAVFGETPSPPPPPPPPPPVREAWWKDSQLISAKLADKDIKQNEITAESGTDPLTEKTFITYRFSDEYYVYLNYFEESEFLVSVPLEKLAAHIQDLLKEAETQNWETLQLRLIISGKDALAEENRFIRFDKEPIDLFYLEGADRLARQIRVNKGDRLTNGMISAIKLYYLEKELKVRVPELKINAQRSDLEVGFDPSQSVSRKVEIQIVLKEKKSRK